LFFRVRMLHLKRAHERVVYDLLICLFS